MEDNIDISIIVPVYNVEKYIHKCINSLINQTKKEIEIILVDDGSPDNCGKICDEYAKNDSRIVVIHKQNGGVSAARNDGIKVAKGKWMAFVDSDDWVEEDMCEKAYNYAIKDNPDMVLFNHFSNYENKEEINDKIPNKEFYTEDSEIIKKLQLSILHPKFAPYCEIFSLMGAPWNKLFRSDIVKKYDIQFPISVKGVYDDALFCLKYYQYVNILSFFPAPLYHYRRLSTSILNKFKSNRLEINQRIFEELYSFLEPYKNDEMYMKAFYSRVIFFLSFSINVYFFNKDNPMSFGEKISELKKTIKEQPYKEALEKVDSNFLGKAEKLYCKLLRKNMVVMTYMVYFVRNKLNEFKGRKKE